MAQFLHEGNAIDYVPGADVAAGDVVAVGSMLGVANDAIPAGRTGALAVEGVFTMAKDGSAYTAGYIVDWDGSTIIATVASPIGIVVKDAGAGDATAWVKLQPGLF